MKERNLSLRVSELQLCPIICQYFNCSRTVDNWAVAVEQLNLKLHCIVF